jgi:hypothetical protein
MFEVISCWHHESLFTVCFIKFNVCSYRIIVYTIFPLNALDSDIWVHSGFVKATPYYYVRATIFCIGIWWLLLWWVFSICCSWHHLILPERFYLDSSFKEHLTTAQLITFLLTNSLQFVAVCLHFLANTVVEVSLTKQIDSLHMACVNRVLFKERTNTVFSVPGNNRNRLLIKNNVPWR